MQAMVDAGQRPGFGRVAREDRQNILRWIMSDGLELAYAGWRETRGRASDHPGEEVGSSGAASAQYQYATPTGSSLQDSGVAVESETSQAPPSGGSTRSDDAIAESGRGEGVEEVLLDSFQEAARDGGGALGPSVLGISHGSPRGNDQSFSEITVPPEMWGGVPDDWDQFFAELAAVCHEVDT